MALAPTTHPLLNAIRAAQQRHSFLPLWFGADPQPVVVGVSGGADSVCLLHLLHTLATEWRLSLHVAHLDHALRPESAQDAEFVHELALQWRVPFYLKRLTEGELQGKPGGLEAAARTARYAYLSSVARSLSQMPTVAVAHHADDQAETLLLNLVRGSGLRGLAGMRWQSQLSAPPTAAQTEQRPVTLIRPLLGVRRTEILQYLADHQLTWREDETNQQSTYTRNYLRHQVLPALAQINPQIVETLARTTEILASENERAEQHSQQLLKAMRIEEAPDQRLVLNLRKWPQFSIAEQRAILHLALEHFQPIGDHNHSAHVGFDHIEQLRLSLQANSNHAHAWQPLLAGIGWSILADPWRLSLHRFDSLPVQPDTPLLPTNFAEIILPIPGNYSVLPGWQLRVTLTHKEDLPKIWRINRNRWQAFLAAEAIRQLTLTTPAPAMRIAPFGMNGQHKVLGDLFTDHKTPVALRNHWPLLVADLKRGKKCGGPEKRVLVWVCGYTISHQVRITEKTEQVLWLQWNKETHP